MSPIGPRTNRSQAVFSACTDLVAQMFYWSLRGREAVLFSSQIGFRL